MIVFLSLCQLLPPLLVAADWSVLWAIPDQFVRCPFRLGFVVHSLALFLGSHANYDVDLMLWANDISEVLTHRFSFWVDSSE